MKFTYGWLKRHLDTKASPEEISEKLTSVGLEVEDMHDPSKTFAPFKVAYVEKAEKHPDADKLKVCTVRTENGTLQVVCGAPNARTGMKGIFAPEGTYIPGTDLLLKKTKIRGVESNGMLVSERELCLSDEHEGIIEVDEKFEIGTPIADVYGLNDPVFEISLTPNRIDCAGVRGIARDLAAAGIGTLKKQDESAVKGKFKSPVTVMIEDTDGCNLFLGRSIKGVKNGPSPQWLQQLLKAVGLRPISALVDITNFLSMDNCRPLHVYDADKLRGNIVVRQAKKGESFDALNDKSYETQGNEVGIYDESGLIGLGGIVGGVSTGCTEGTVNVFLEAAYFNPIRIARAGRTLQVDSDARYRFERGIDPEFTFAGIEIATRLILELCGGEASDVVQAGKAPDWKRSIDFDPACVQHLIGVDVDVKEQKKILEALGFDVAGGKTFKVRPPSWRGDVEGRADLAEEIIRIKGFEHIPATSVRNDATRVHAAETLNISRARKARTALGARGFNECVTWSFMRRDIAEKFGANQNQVMRQLALLNPISADLDQMRPSALGNLIDAARGNHDRGYADVALCEVGPVFRSQKPDGQDLVATGIRAGVYNPRHWADANSARPVDAFDAKGDAMAALEACGAPAANAQITRDAPDYYHPGRSGTLRLGNTVLAHFGEIHPAILADMDVKTPLVGFEVFLQAIPEARKKSGTEKSLLKLEPLMPLTRDFAFVVDQGVEADALLRAAKAADKNLVKEASIFDIYIGKGVEDGKKSVALSITIQPGEKTLTDTEIEALAKKVVDLVTQKTGATLRG
jgi:phenylalanyl-tRNA synthetase beta chain